jgi:hypothetical protein
MARNIAEYRQVELIYKSVEWTENCTHDAKSGIRDNSGWEDKVNEILNRSCVVQSSKLDCFILIIVTDGIKKVGESWVVLLTYGGY